MDHLGSEPIEPQIRVCNESHNVQPSYLLRHIKTKMHLNVVCCRCQAAADRRDFNDAIDSESVFQHDFGLVDGILVKRPYLCGQLQVIFSIFEYL